MSASVSVTSAMSAPYGSWKSLITSDMVSGSAKQLGGFATDTSGRLFWLESRPSEEGRFVLVRGAENEGSQPTDITPKGFSVRTLVQEYGGGAFNIFGDSVIFSNYDDQRLYKQSISSNVSAPVPITPNYGGPIMRYADGVFDSRFNRFLTVREDHRISNINATTTLVSVDLSNPIQEPEILVQGSDFYAFPRLDPKGERIAWIQWNHPHMPWDRAELWVGYLSEDGKIKNRVCVAGCDASIVEAPSEPKWTPEGELFFITDRKNGFWNIYKWIESTNEVLPIYSLDAEFSRPMWNFGLNSYDFVQSSTKNLIACSYRLNGRSYFGILDVDKGNISLLEIPLTDINNIMSGLDCLYVEAASAVQPSSVAKVVLDDEKSKVVNFTIVWSSSTISPSLKPYISSPELIEFPTEVLGQTAYAFYYPPTNPLYQPNPDEKPILLLRSHGGPTTEARGVLDLNIQYWTSRGWGYVDVNYGGSSGYGREYRERLLGQWGIVDVNDCCSCAKFLVDSGKVDSKKLCITGGSAGGYTTLATLAFRDVFNAGAPLYGFADLPLLMAETPKFESHYVEILAGSKQAMIDRSPINLVDKFSCPIILFQGSEDKVVPPDHTKKIYQAVKDKGVPVGLVMHEGEQHGFRKAENIKTTLEQGMVFFARLVGHFQVADNIVPIRIDNFDPPPN